MRALEVYFDYACPYCYKGHEYLVELLPLHPDIEVVWRPCEAHPRPERYGMHSDLCIQGLFYAYDISEVWVVPAYRMGGKKLDSIEDVGVTKDQLAEFLAF